jgi:hypothetical protein
MSGVEISALRIADVRRTSAGVLGVGLVLAVLPVGIGPPCPLRSFTGVPCPLCGTTAAVRALLDADPVGALAANPFGILAVLVAVLLVAVPPAVLRVPARALVAAGLASWLFQLDRFGIL